MAKSFDPVHYSYFFEKKSIWVPVFCTKFSLLFMFLVNMISFSHLSRLSNLVLEIDFLRWNFKFNVALINNMNKDRRIHILLSKQTYYRFRDPKITVKRIIPKNYFLLPLFTSPTPRRWPEPPLPTTCHHQHVAIAISRRRLRCALCVLYIFFSGERGNPQNWLSER